MTKKLSNELKLALVMLSLATVADFKKNGLNKDKSEALKNLLSFIFIEFATGCMDNETRVPNETVNQAYEMLTKYLGEPTNWFSP